MRFNIISCHKGHKLRWDWMTCPKCDYPDPIPVDWVASRSSLRKRAESDDMLAELLANSLGHQSADSPESAMFHLQRK